MNFREEKLENVNETYDSTPANSRVAMLCPAILIGNVGLIVTYLSILTATLIVLF